MTALPPATDFTGPTVTEGQLKTAVTALRAFLAGLLGSDGTAAAARTALGAEPADADILKADTTATLTVGFAQTPNNLGVASGGAKSPTFANGNFQYVSVDADITFNAPSTGQGGILIECINASGAHAPTFSSFSAILLPNSMDWDAASGATNWVIIRRRGTTSYYGVYNYAP